MDYESARAIFGEMDGRLADIGASVRDLVEVVKAADRGRNDALSFVGSIKAAMQMQDVEIQAIKDRLAALEKERVQIPNAAIDNLRHRVERLKEFLAGLEANANAQSDALEANEQAVQSCLSTLGEVNKVVAAIAARIPG